LLGTCLRSLLLINYLESPSKYQSRLRRKPPNCMKNGWKPMKAQ
jgi:hypothetical protein